MHEVKYYVDHPEEFPVGKGWHEILADLFANLPLDAEVYQIKEKFGGLRVYMEGDDKEPIATLIQQAENEAIKTCEECGEEGSPRSIAGWITTLCFEHYKQRADSLFDINK